MVIRFNFTAIVRVINEVTSGDGSEDDPYKIAVREDAGTITLHFEFEFPPSTSLINVRCQTSDGTASKYIVLCICTFSHVVILL